MNHDTRRISGVNLDITERKRAEAQLQQSQVRFRVMAELSSDWCWEQDAEGRISFLSSGYDRHSGALTQTTLGQRPWDDNDRTPLTGSWDAHRAIFETKRPFRNFEYSRLGSDGQMHWISLDGEPIFGERGEFLGYRGVGHNVSGRKNAELALRAARDAARSASRAKSEFMAHMSHEIRTPLSAITLLTHLALRQPGDPVQTDYLGKIQGASKMLVGIVSDIVDLSKIEAGQLHIEQTEFDLNDVINDVAVMIGQRASEKKLHFVVDAAPDLPAALLGDPVRIAQILSNLCRNAIKFTEQGEVELKVRTVAALSANPAGRVTFEFAVRDTGIGLSPQRQQALFDPEAPSDELAPSTRRSAGIGLSISRQLAELMGGHIWVHSEVGQGSTFSFTVVCELVPAKQTPTQVRSAALAGLRALVIDDDALFLRVTQERLQSWGVATSATADAQHGLELLAQACAAGQPIEAVLLDWRLIGTDGLAACALIRSDPRIAPQPKIVMISASRDGALEDRANATMADGVLLKPISPLTLCDTLLKLLHPTDTSAQRDVPDLTGVRILLAEDDPVNQVVALGLLEPTGATLTVAGNGREVLRLIKARQAQSPGVLPFDVVLMDSQMPELDGIDAARQIRLDPELAKLPIIAMTASAMRGDRERLLAAGMNDYIAKPVSVRTLHAALVKWTRK